MIDLATLPEPVRRFVEALRENARRVPTWDVPSLEGSKCFADTIVYVYATADGRITICDNYERFFSTIYDFRPDPADPSGGTWSIRQAYSDEPGEPYTFEQAMADAAIMFTG